MSKRIGGLQAKVARMVRHSRGRDNAEIRSFMAKSSVVAKGSGGGGAQYPEQALTIGGEYVTLNGDYLLMR